MQEISKINVNIVFFYFPVFYSGKWSENIRRLCVKLKNKNKNN